MTLQNSSLSSYSNTITAPSFSSSPSLITPSTNIQQSFSIKLTSKNYIPWKLQFTPLFNLYLHGIANGTEVAPPREIIDSNVNQSILNPEYTAWFAKDQLLFSEVWRALASAYGVVSHAQRTQLHIELQNLSKDEKPVSQYLYQAKAIADSLTSAGQAISTSEFNAIIFRKLGAEYRYPTSYNLS
ncbi:conserved hypothetical protein [Ricinus communis]|uniref:Retrotransposon Copia-like N-terminal domain-containing protein n=1 Tax=Ricinus communis TaxID=3988 RepID=B9S2K7_RICCO|nr:conserved hypothetical protein [Ricinus communis]